ncbi:threonine-phosphate decarboxylase CobD [Microvirga terricola]|uniref:8-amino-7-oxononanoate synthase n=1 Tax=Microvirga terricola TaxID=2719797 RepID=A0ABX0VEF3_9HYPH|nr:threonine-phosphate decarboxylase CobD [Microvirga terricola]NIX77868.1 threonine-phosphate decarboxylase [Microvirga terricola]
MQHGGNLHDAKALFPEAPEPWIDLSTGINPNAYPVSLPDLRAFTRLPSPQEVGHTEAVAARAYGVSDPARVVATAGSQATIRLLPRLRDKSKVAIVGPTYSEHERSWVSEGHDIQVATSLADALALTPDVVVIANPNNPDGRIADPTELAEAASILHRRGGWLVVDEAFADLDDEASIAGKKLPGTIVLRSFGKAYGLAGVRLGFAICDPVFSVRIREELGPWAVSGPALALGAQALGDAAWLADQKVRLARACLVLDELLTRADFHIVGGTRLFRLARHPQAGDWFERLARSGIWVRKFNHEQTILRLGIPQEEMWDRLRGALA